MSTCRILCSGVKLSHLDDEFRQIGIPSPCLTPSTVGRLQGGNMAVVEIFDLTRAPEFEELLGKANGRLALEETVPEDVRTDILQVADVISNTETGELSELDPYLLSALQSGASRALFALFRIEDPKEQRRRLRLTIEQMRHALRDVNEGLHVREGADTKDIAIWLAEVMDVPQARLADLVGASPRQLQRWINREDPTYPKDDNAYRVRIIARIVNQLRHALTARGVLNWFEHPHPELKGDAPFALLPTKGSSSLQNVEFLLRLASSARSHSAT